MKILVTGANGYLGKGIVKQLLDDGHDVVATDIDSNFIDKRSEIKCCDLFSVADPFTFFGKPDILLHLAWRDGFVHGSDRHIQDLCNHFEFIRRMISSGIKQIAILGSMHEIGFYEGSINEDTCCNPQSKYGIAKNALRQLIELEIKGKSIVFQWLRGFYIVGNSVDGSSIFSKLIRAAKNGQTKFPFTLGLNQFDFLDYEEFCEDVALTIEQSEVTGIINICSGRPEKLADRVERFIKENNLSIELDYGAFPDRPYDSKAIWGDDSKISKIRSLYGK